MKIHTKTLITKLDQVQSAVGKTGLKTAKINLESSVNGLEVVVILPNMSLAFSTAADVSEDGEISFLFGDLYPLLNGDDEISNDTVNFIPIFAQELVKPITMIGESYLFDDQSTKTFLAVLKDNRKPLKKSIFDESEFIKIDVSKNKIGYQLVSPTEWSNDNSDMNYPAEGGTILLDKTAIKTILDLFNKKLAIRFYRDFTELSNDQFKLQIARPEINLKMFNPEIIKD